MQHHLSPSISRLQIRPKRVRKVLASVSINSLASLTTFLNVVTTHVHDFQQSGQRSPLTQISAVWTQKLSGGGPVYWGLRWNSTRSREGTSGSLHLQAFQGIPFWSKKSTPYSVSLLRKISRNDNSQNSALQIEASCGRNVFFLNFYAPLSESLNLESRILGIFISAYFSQ